MNYEANQCQPHEFLDLLFGHVPSGFCEVLYLAPEGVDLYPHTIVQWREMPLGAIDPGLPTIHEKNQQGYSCYFAPAVRNRLYEPEQRISKKTGKPYWVSPRGKAADAQWITALWVDIDSHDQESFDRLANSILFPSIIISSGGGWHGYWLLEKPLEITDDNRADIVQTLKGLAVYHQGDTKVADLARVMRLPGTINTKPSRGGALCEVVDIIPGGYHFMDAYLQYAPFGAPKLPQPTRTMQIDGSKHIPRWVEDYLNTGARQGERNQRLYAAARALLDNGFTLLETESLCKARALSDGLDEHEIDATITSAERAPRGTPTGENYMNVRIGVSDKRLSGVKF